MNSTCPLGATRAAPVKLAKTTLVRRRAEGIMLGSIMMAMSSRGPRPRPVRKAKPSIIPNLVDLKKKV